MGLAGIPGEDVLLSLLALLRPRLAKDHLPAPPFSLPDHQEFLLLLALPLAPSLLLWPSP